ncbi:MAG: MopE-related protein [Myxococcota bacterium]|nr:MopE-related protein [Myxococcota bacterium]
MTLGLNGRFFEGTLLLLAGLLLASCTDVVEQAPTNQAPSARIFAPVEGAVFGHGDLLTLTGSCIDPESAEASLVFRWSSDLDEVLLEGEVDQQGNVAGTSTLLSEGNHEITLTCIDPDGGVGEDSKSIVAEPNEAPRIEIDEPDMGSHFTTDDEIAVVVEVADDVDSPEDLVLSVESDLDGVVREGIVPDGTGSAVVTISLLAGNHLLTVSAVDLEGAIGTATVAVEVESLHGAPDCAIVEPLSGAFELGSNILFRGQVNDPDVDPEVLAVSWSTDLEGEFLQSEADSSGAVQGFYDGLSVGDHVLTMLVVDEENFECSTDTPLRICVENEAPTVEWGEPLVAEHLAGDSILFSAVVGDDLTELGDLEVSWESDLDGVFNEDPPDAAGQLFFLYDQLSPGTHAVTVRVDDGCGHQTSASMVLEIQVDEDGDGVLAEPWGADCDDADPTVFPGAPEIPYDGIDQDCSGSDLTDVDLDGYESELAGGDDCDDSNAGINPGVVDIPYDGIDQDCSGLDAIDLDGDGYEGGPNGVDCNDNNASINPGAIDIPYNNIDEDCSGADLVDVDQDGDVAILAGGRDCDDTDPTISSSAPEQPYDGIDQDCDGFDLIDVDSDGHDALIAGGTDCDDLNPFVFPGAPEVAYDGVDQDCDGSDWDDVDGDGFVGLPAGGTDCDDTNPAVNPNAVEVPYDGIDQDCVGGDLTDIDGDGYDAVQVGGSDCDDDEFLTNPGAGEIPYDGIDQDCDGEDLTDVDGDGFLSEVVGGTDCDDNLPSVYPGAPEVPGDGLDNDCNGSIDDVDPASVPSLVGAPYLCNPILLSGAGSYGPPGPPLTYAWFIAAKPTNSMVDASSLSTPSSVTTTFTPDLPGSYLIGLTVTQGILSDTEYVVVETLTDPLNQAPVADAGSDVSTSASVNSYTQNYSQVCPSCPSRSVTLDGTDSSDPDGNPLSYSWTVVSGNASVSNSASASATGNLNGGTPSYASTSTWSYTFRLEVEDCEGQTDTDEVQASYSCSCY